MKFVKQRKQQIILLLIITLGAFLRFYNLNWDQGHHLHPDERAIVMFTTPLQFPKSVSEFLSPTSPWNPHFFAYGNFPLYLLKIASLIAGNFDPSFATYDKINLVGRFLSSLFDLGTLFVVFLLGKKLFSKKIGIIAAFFYATTVFPIQLSHFYAVDTLLTFFVLCTLYAILLFYEKPTKPKAALIGILFGLSLATKISATVLLSSIGMALIIDFVLIFLKNPHRPHVWFPHVPKFAKRLFIDGAIIATVTLITFAVFEPYAILDFKTFWQHTLQQRQMTYDAFTFPYTLQYVGKIPYLYELKNIFLWGLGPILATLSFAGALYFIFHIVRKHLGWWNGGRSPSSPAGQAWESNDFDSSEVDGHLRGVHSATSKVQTAQMLIIATFFFTYFLIVGKFAVGWMRYMLPLYPLFSLFGAIFFYRLLIFLNNHLTLKQFSIFNLKFLIKSKKLNFKNYDNKNSFQISNFKFQIGLLVFIGSILLWPLSFMYIYTKPNTRVLASQWIYQNIPADKTIAREHWDDGLPIGGNIAYKTLELPIYEMENPLREAQIYQMIQEADYIIIASNRLYVPLQKLSKNCHKWNLPEDRCSHNANRYYEKLFNGELGYKKVAEFSVYPKLEVSSLKLEIDDSSADESFSVYDHPKVMIFKKILF